MAKTTHDVLKGAIVDVRQLAHRLQWEKERIAKKLAAAEQTVQKCMDLVKAARVVGEYDWELVILERDTGDPLNVLGFLGDALADLDKSLGGAGG